MMGGLGKIDLPGEFAAFREWMTGVTDHLAFFRHHMEQRQLQAGTQRRQARLSTYVVQCASADRATLLSDRSLLARDIVIQALPSNTSNIVVSGKMANLTNNIGYILTPGAPFAMAVPDVREFANTYYDLNDIGISGASGQYVTVTAVTYTAAEGAA